MALVATIDGVRVYSDKEVTSVAHTLISFSDGSTCDVRTNTVNNKGPGYISIGSEIDDDPSSIETIGPKQFDAKHLELDGIFADIQVDAHNGMGVEYTISGPADEVKAIGANVVGDTLVVRDIGPSGRRGGSTVIKAGGGRVTVGHGSVSILSNIRSRGDIKIDGLSIKSGLASIFSDDRPNKTKVTIKVPKGASLLVGHVQGRVVVGDTGGQLVAQLQGGYDLRAGKVSAAQLTIQGSGDAYVQEVNGSMTATIQGSGDVVVDSGEITSLHATVQGSGSVKVRTSVATANLAVMGSGDIDVTHVQGRLSKNTMGSGSIKVRRTG